MRVNFDYFDRMKKAFSLALILFSLLLLSAPFVHAQGSINGVAKLTLKDDKTAFADWVRVLLVRSEAEIPKFPDLDHMGKFERIEATRNLHTLFFVNVREKMSDPEYVVRSTLTTPDGTFQFSEIPHGTYFILVTFPAMIRDYKVAWQAPVTVNDNETAFIELNNANLLIPTYSR